MEKTGLDQIVSIHFDSREGPWRSTSSLADDPRWQLAQRIVDSAQFSKSPRLSSFLLYIVSKSLEGRQSEVTEQQIGVHVFGRPLGYRTVDDNIVRSYARQLRKRLAEYFAGDGIDDAMRIEIPLGGYLPAFTTPGLPAEDEHKPILVERTLAERTMTSTVDFASSPVSVPRRKGGAQWRVHACWLVIAPC